MAFLQLYNKAGLADNPSPATKAFIHTVGQTREKDRGGEDGVPGYSKLAFMVFFAEDNE